MSEALLVSEWRKNSREWLRVRLDTFRDRPVVDIRTWYEDTEGQMKPGRGGLTVSAHHLPQLAAALNKACEVAVASGLIEPDSPESD